MPKGVRIEVKNPIAGIDLQSVSDEFHQVMVDYTTNQLKTWVIATTDVVPVLTGAAKASFWKLAHIAGYELQINPRKEPVRIADGISTSTGELIAIQGDSYGWTWSSDLDHIAIVDDRVRFLEVGQRVLDGQKPPELPTPSVRYEN